MALLLANGTRTAGVNRLFSGTTSVAGAHRKQNIGVPHTHLNFAAGQHSVADVTSRASVPDGAQHPVAYKFARKTGNIASRYECAAAFTIGTLNLAEGRNLEATAAIVWTVPDAQLQLVVSAEGAAAITFTVANAALAGALDGSGTTTFAFTVSAATLGAIVDALATAGITFSGSATASAIGHMEGDITPFTDLSPENLAASVLASVVEDDVSLGDVLRILLAHAAGDATGLDTNPAFKSHDGSKTRVAGTISSGARTITTFDAT